MLDEFGREAIDRMIENIRNEFPITNGVETEQAKRLEAVNANLRAELHQARNLAEFQVREEREAYNLLAIAILERESHNKLIERIIDDRGRNFVVKMKLRKGIELTQEETEFLISKLQ